MKRHSRTGGTRFGYRALTTTVSLLPLVLAAPAAWAQDTLNATAVEPAAEQVGAADQSGQTDIVVTGTRIQSAGFSQPTPVTSVTADELSLSAPGSLSESLAPLPELRLSTNPQGGQGASSNMGAISQLNLRGLGPNRTLVLLNGHRLTPANTGSAPDINMLPQQLIKRVDLVTGGASAAYGSDAVAGVVNFILDEDFSGFKGEVQSGITSRGDGESYKIGGALGLHLFDNRLHVIASAEYYDRKGVLPTADCGWSQRHYLPLTNPDVSASNPASPSNPNFIIAPDATIANQTPGGLIASGPLAGTEFIDGQPDPFVYGALRTGAFMQGGDGIWPGDIVSLALPLRRHNEFVQATYDITDQVHLYASFSNGFQTARSLSQVPNDTFTIFRENPFIPEGLSIGDLASFPLSKFFSDLGGSKIRDRGTNTEFVGGLKGTLDVSGKNWSWDLSYQRGTSTYRRDLFNNINRVNIYNATDSVVVTAANQGNSGLAIGSVVCRTSLTLPSNGCVPINPFIPLSQNTQEALDYVLFPAWFEQKIKQQSVQGSISGDVFDGWAGPISFATGGEYRKISTDVTSDPLSQTFPADYVAATAPGIRGLPGSVAKAPNPGVGRFGNFQPLSGSFNVKEAFVELNVPLLRDVPLIHMAELNGAYRYTDYSTSGGVSTWKVGLVWDLTSQFRIRGTRSRDIRAPNIVELNSPSKQKGTTITDPTLNNAAFVINTFEQGNPALKPEIADTVTLGLVYRPTASSGLRASVDGYDIKIKDAIILPGAQDVVDGCVAGVSGYCDLITRTDGAPTGAITSIETSYFNGQQIRERGIDFELSYRTPVDRLFSGASGSLLLRGLANYVDRYSLSQGPGLPDIDKAGEVGAPGSGSTGVFGVPHWTGTVSAGYSTQAFTAFVQGRYVGGGKYDNTFNTDKYNAPGQPITYINDNDVNGRFYTDLTLRWDFGTGGKSYELAASVTNLFDVDPPIVPTRASVYPSQTNGLLYDTLGRRFTVTFRFKL